MSIFIKNKKIGFAILSLALLLMPVLAYGASAPGGGNTLPSATGGGNTTYTYNNGVAILKNPLQFNTICGLVKGVLNAAMVIGVPIAVLFIVWAGLQFVLAQGNAEKLSNARRNFLNVLIGIAIFVGASLIATVITKTIESLGVTGISDCS